MTRNGIDMRTIRLNGVKNGKFVVEQWRDDSPAIECFLTETLWMLLLWLVRSYLSRESFANLLPHTANSKPVLHKTIERLRAALDDKPGEFVAWDYSTHYHIAAVKVLYSPGFLECRKLIKPETLIDDIVRLIDEQFGQSAA